MYIQWMPKVVNRSLWSFATCHYYFWKHIIQIPTASPHGLCCINTIPWCNHWGDWLPFYAPPPRHEQHLQCSPCLSSSGPHKPGCGEYGSLWDHEMVWVSIPETHATISDSCNVMNREKSSAIPQGEECSRVIRSMAVRTRVSGVTVMSLFCNVETMRCEWRPAADIRTHDEPQATMHITSTQQQQCSAVHAWNRTKFHKLVLGMRPAEKAGIFTSSVMISPTFVVLDDLPWTMIFRK